MPETVGVISDTHGLLRPEALAALAGVSRIVHAGDVGGPEVLGALEAIAPVLPVRGNTDRGAFGASLPLSRVVEIPLGPGTAPALLYVLHIPEDLDLDPRAAGFHAVVHGHTHRPRVEERGGVLFLNPGSAGPRRFDCPVTLARLEIGPGEGPEDAPVLRAEVVELA